MRNFSPYQSDNSSVFWQVQIMFLTQSTKTFPRTNIFWKRSAKTIRRILLWYVKNIHPTWKKKTRKWFKTLKLFTWYLRKWSTMVILIFIQATTNNKCFSRWNNRWLMDLQLRITNLTTFDTTHFVKNLRLVKHCTWDNTITFVLSF